LASNQVFTCVDWVNSSIRVTVSHGIGKLPLSSTSSTSGLPASAGVANTAVRVMAANAALMDRLIPDSF
jgi:hypothetical protein